MLRRFLAAVLVCGFATMPGLARPARWCGWYARHHLVPADPGPRFNAACAWRDYGTAASGPAVGVLVIWCSKHHRHVGKIVGGEPGQWIIKSGNDGGRVRERLRSVRGAAAFRWSPR